MEGWRGGFLAGMAKLRRKMALVRKRNLCPMPGVPFHSPRVLAVAPLHSFTPFWGRGIPRPQMKLLGVAALAAGVAMLAGCAPGLEERLEAAQEYAQGKAEETEAFFRTNAAPLTLGVCRELAHRRTLKLTQARLDAQLARFQSLGAFSAFLPQVEATYQRAGTGKTMKTNLRSLGITAQMQDRWVTESALTISQPVFAPNAWLLWLAARRGAELQRLTAERNEQMLDVQVAALFYQAAVAARTIRAYEAQAEASAELKRQVEALAAEGMALRGETARAQAYHQSDLYNAQVARDNARSAKANLLDLLNFHPLAEAPEPVGESLLEVRRLPWAIRNAKGEPEPCARELALAVPPEEWLWTALVSRKEMWAGDLAITLRKTEALAALAHFLPTLSVSGGGAYTSNDFLTPHRTLTGGIGGVMSVFDGMRSISDYLAAKERERAAYALREDAAATLAVSVWQAWANWRQARERKSVAEAVKVAAEVDYDETYARYQNDRETLSEVLDKFAAREQARIDALSSDYADALAEFVFRDAIGLGWGEGVPEDLAGKPLLQGLEETE